MTRRIFFLLSVLGGGAFAWACSSDASSASSSDVDAGGGRAMTPPSTDADSAALACGDATGAPPRALVALGRAEANEVVAVNLGTGAVDGRFSYDGGIGLLATNGTDPYFLDPEKDSVTRLDAKEPWKAVGTWNVHGGDGADDEPAYPVGVVSVSCDKAYVLRYNRNQIAVIDPGHPEKGVVKSIDLSALKRSADPDWIDMTSAVFVPSKRRLYVVLGNFDRSTPYAGGHQRPVLAEPSYVCGNMQPTASVIALDVDSDAVVSLGGSALGGGVALGGTNPAFTAPVVYDAAGDRLVVHLAGCLSPDLPTPTRQIDEVSLSTNATAALLVQWSSNELAEAMAYLDGEHALLTDHYSAWLWNPSDAGVRFSRDQIMQMGTLNGRGGFVGIHSARDAGRPFDLVSVSADGTEIVPVLNDVYPGNYGGVVSAVSVWPHP